MKKIIFCLMLMMICVKVNALESFYFDSEKVSDMWITKEKNGEKRSANPYMIKREKDDTYVFCLEPFTLLVNGVKYKQDNDYTKYGLSEKQFNRINLIAYYGFGYKNHTSKKWYGVTQYLIWQEVDKKANIYFSSTQNGAKKDLYTKEIQEIEDLINEHNKKFTIDDKYKISIGEKLEIKSNINLEDYKIITDIPYQLEGNIISIENLEVGSYNIKLEKINNRFSNNMMMYQNSTSQDVILPGFTTSYEKQFEFSVEVVEGSLKFSKESSETKEKLSGATYGIYTEDKLVSKITTSQDDTFITLPIGKYKIKELVAPPGYKLDDKEYEFEITYDNLDVEITLTDDKIIVNVPQTGLKDYKKSSYLLIIIGIIGLLYDKKKYQMH